MNKRSMGAEQETRAAAYLTALGYRILRRNYRCPYGEIDLVAFHNGYLVFIEVKYRKNQRAGYGIEAVNYGKQRRICQTAQYYLCASHLPEEVSVRFDVLSIDGKQEEITLLENAFDYIGR